MRFVLRCARDTCQFVAPLHVWMAPALQEIMIGEVQSSLAVMCPAC
jgi:hypothetical protein